MTIEKIIRPLFCFFVWTIDEELVAGQLREEEEEDEEEEKLQTKETVEPVHLSKSP
jgi:hypothetical protein